MNTSPLHQFKTFVGQDLKDRHGWGVAAWELLRKHNDTVESFWANGAPVDGVADFINEMQLSAPVKAPSFPTRKSLEAAGIKFRSM